MFKNMVWMLSLIMSSLAFAQTDVIITDSKSTSTVTTNSNSVNETTVKSPPASAISPSFNIVTGKQIGRAHV